MFDLRKRLDNDNVGWKFIMDKKRGLLNIGVSITFKILLLLGSILVRRFLIQYIGNEANGLSSLYISIIGFLTVAELGVGEAIIFCMYKPIVEGDKDKVAALYTLFKKLYSVVGGIIFLAGLIVMFFLPQLAKDYSTININIYLTFFLTLVSVVLTYAYSAKISLLNAYKNNYIATTIVSCGTLLEDVLKIGAIVVTRSFSAYLLCGIIAVLVQWIVTNIVTNREYHDIMHKKAVVDIEDRKQIISNIKAMFMHKIGAVLVNTTDSAIISAFIGVVVLGKYTNYTTIMTSMTGLLGLFFYPLTSVIGHVFVSSSKEEMNRYFYFFYGFNYILGTVFCLGYYAVIDNVITLCFGNNLELSRDVAFVITINYFIQFLRTSTLMFRSSTGTFYYDRWKPLIEGIVNLVLSIALVKVVGMTGVIVATIITNLLINDIVEPYVVFKHALERKPTRYYIMNYSYILLFAVSMLAIQGISVVNDNIFIEFVLNGSIAVAVSIIPCLLMVITNGNFRSILCTYMKRIRKEHIN